MKINGSKNIQTHNDLGKNVEILRKELIKVGLHYGLNSREALTKSQELDRYLSICQKSSPKGHNK